MVDIIKGLAGGARIALVLFAFMALLAWRRPKAASWPDWLREFAWLGILIAAVSYSPAHASWLFGSPLPKIWSMSLDLAASAIAAIAVIVRLAAGGLERGLSMRRVQLGAGANVGILLLVEVAAWLTR